MNSKCARHAAVSHVGLGPVKLTGETPKVQVGNNGQPRVKGNGSRQCRESPILPLASSKTLMTPS